MDTVRDTDLYPPIKPYAKGLLDVGDGHSLHYDLSGNANATPVIFVHGGPGAGTVPTQRRYFDPQKYHIILLDQRGCGRSRPYASRHANTTDHLVADMEALRAHLGIDKWLVAGGSWGATLALAYGTRHAERCLGFILRGVFLGTASEVDWFLSGMASFFPEHHQDFSNHIGGQGGGDQGGRGPNSAELLDAYCARLFDPDPNRHLPAARAWARYESLCSTLRPHPLPQGGPAFDHYALALARIEAHYFKHNLFLQDDELINRLHTIFALPAIIVQGRYDVICPIKTAYRLHLAWPDSRLVVVDDAGHSGLEAGISRALSQAADDMARTL